MYEIFYEGKTQMSDLVKKKKVKLRVSFYQLNLFNLMR